MLVPKPAITREQVDYTKLDKKKEWALVELSYWGKHFAKATEMLVKQKELILYEPLSFGEVGLLHAISRYAKLADEGEMVGSPLKVLVCANTDELMAIKAKLNKYEAGNPIVWIFLSELESFQAAIKTTEELCRTSEHMQS